MESATFRYGSHDAFYQSENRHYEKNAVLLHGYSFNSDVWQKVGLYDALLDAGFNVYGIDVPGFPNGRSRFSIDDEAMVKFLKRFVDEKIGAGKLVMLGSSASCGFVLRFAENYSNAVDAAVLVGPAGIGEVDAGRIKADMLVVWGSDDPHYANKKEMDMLNWIKKKTVVVLEGAGHACYLDKPKEFVKSVTGFLKKQ